MAAGPGRVTVGDGACAYTCACLAVQTASGSGVPWCAAGASAGWTGGLTIGLVCWAVVRPAEERGNRHQVLIGLAGEPAGLDVRPHVVVEVGKARPRGLPPWRGRDLSGARPGHHPDHDVRLAVAPRRPRGGPAPDAPPPPLPSPRMARG